MKKMKKMNKILFFFIKLIEVFVGKLIIILNLNLNIYILFIIYDILFILTYYSKIIK